MALQAFLASSYRAFERSGVSDVATIITDFQTEVLANSPVWTDSGGGLFVSPVDAVGRFFDVLLTRIDAERLEMRLRDQAGVTICTRRINCPSTNTWVSRIYTGQFHFIIDVEMESAAPEALYGGISDMSPEAQDAHTKYVYGGGYRTNADVASQYDISYAFMLDNVAAAAAQRRSVWGGLATTGTGAVSLQSARVHRAALLWVQPIGGGNLRYAGKQYQVLMVSSAVTVGTRLTVPIDIAATGVFRVIGGIPTMSSCNRVLAARIA